MNKELWKDIRVAFGIPEYKEITDDKTNQKSPNLNANITNNTNNKDTTNAKNIVIHEKAVESHHPPHVNNTVNVQTDNVPENNNINNNSNEKHNNVNHHIDNKVHHPEIQVENNENNVNHQQNPPNDENRPVELADPENVDNVAA